MLWFHRSTASSLLGRAFHHRNRNQDYLMPSPPETEPPDRATARGCPYHTRRGLASRSVYSRDARSPGETT